MFNSELKQSFINNGLDEEFEELKTYCNQYNSRYIRMIKPQENKPKRLIGQNGLHYIQLALNRSKMLFEGAVISLNNKKGLNAMLCARAHLESTGSVAYLYRKLNSFYDDRITLEELDRYLYKLTLGTRMEEYSKLPEAINVLNLIEAVDDCYKNLIPKKVRMFREAYDFLSEYCHPNLFGISKGCKINKVGIVRYSKSEELTHQDFGFVHYLLISLSAFFEFYDKIYELLIDNEELPIVFKE